MSDVRKEPIFYRTGNNYDMDFASDVTGLRCEDESLAVQSALEETDINTIVRRFGLTGELPDDLKMPQSGDFSGLPDFQSALNIVREAEAEFLRVPGELRARFGNSPQAFMAFVEDESNMEEAVRLGLRVRPPVPVEPAPLAVRVVPDPVSGVK